MLDDRPSAPDVTALLQQGDAAAFDRLFPLLYEELRAVAHLQRRRWRGDDTLGTTALVHEAYLKLVDQKRANWESRAHFLATAARAIRHILMNYARERRAARRGGSRCRVSLDQVHEQLAAGLPLTEQHSDLLVALDTALRRLEQLNERHSRIVECRFFAGMTIPETAAALGISTASVSRGWALAQVRLYQAIMQELQA